MEKGGENGEVADRGEEGDIGVPGDETGEDGLLGEIGGGVQTLKEEDGLYAKREEEGSGVGGDDGGEKFDEKNEKDETEGSCSTPLSSRKSGDTGGVPHTSAPILHGSALV